MAQHSDLAQSSDQPAADQPALQAMEEAVEQGGTFPPFDASTFPSQLLWLAITFGTLYWLMSKVILPRIGGIIEDRRDRIANDLAEAERLRDETDAAIATYEQELADARQRAHAIAQETRDALNAELEARRAEVDADISERAEAAEKRIADVRAAALAEVDGIAADAAEAIVAKLIGSAERGEIDAAVKSVLAR